jgi:hypothetical protein
VLPRQSRDGITAVNTPEGCFCRTPDGLERNPLEEVGIRNGVKETTGFFEGLYLAFESTPLQKTGPIPTSRRARFISSGDEVAVFGRYEATNRKTGKRVNMPIAHYWKIRNGKVAHYNEPERRAFRQGRRRPLAALCRGTGIPVCVFRTHRQEACATYSAALPGGPPAASPWDR